LEERECRSLARKKRSWGKQNFYIRRQRVKSSKLVREVRVRGGTISQWSCGVRGQRLAGNSGFKYSGERRSGILRWERRRAGFISCVPYYNGRDNKESIFPRGRPVGRSPRTRTWVTRRIGQVCGLVQRRKPSSVQNWGERDNLSCVCLNPSREWTKNF